jgi:hypothetical protein
MDDYTLTHKFFIGSKTEMDYNTERLLLYKELARAMNIKTIAFDKVLSELDESESLNAKVEELMLDAIHEEMIEGSLALFLFVGFILNPENSDQTRNRIIDVFNSDSIIENLENEVVQPKIAITSNENSYVKIPDKHSSIPSTRTSSFEYSSLTIRIDSKNKRLLLDFENRNPLDVVLYSTLKPAEKSENNALRTKKARLNISETNFKYGSYLNFFFDLQISRFAD